MKIRLMLAVMVLASNWLSAQTYEEYVAQGDEYYAARDYAQAIHFFTLALGLEANKPKAYYFRGDAYRELKDYENAIEDYTNALDLDPKNAKYRRLRGDGFYDMKNYARAEADYTKSIELDPKSATTWLYRGDTYEMLKQVPKACADYQQAHALGNRNARPRAVKLACPWVKQITGTQTCPSGDAPISKVEMEPLNGAVFVSKGLGYESFQLLTKGGHEVSGPEFSEIEELSIILKGVSGFCSEVPETIHVGIGFELRENGGREVEKVHNIFPNDKSFSGEEAKNLTLKIDFPETLSTEKQYLLTAHFFDTKGNAELFVELPFKITKTTLHTINLKTEKKVLKNGIVIEGLGGTLSGLELHHKGKGTPVDSSKIESNTDYTFTATEVKNLNKHSHFIFRFLNPAGKIILESKGKAVYHGEHIKLDFSTKDVPAGKYSLWLKVQEIDAPLNVGVVMPVEIK
ncbi:MAG: tetratricopeptide repeat protein [Bacteroidetes bacterium]|nr:tetratricopeptide repeat protein [Bacteroidota bacterium]